VADAPRSVSVLNMMIGTRLRRARMARTASMPFISGISMSIVTRSGLSCSSLPTAMRPLTAVPTTSIAGSSESTSVTILRTTTESSTTNTRIGSMRPPSPRAGACQGRAGAVGRHRPAVGDGCSRRPPGVPEAPVRGVVGRSSPALEPISGIPHHVLGPAGKMITGHFPFSVDMSPEERAVSASSAV
jgi:hypothetical protein